MLKLSKGCVRSPILVLCCSRTFFSFEFSCIWQGSRCTCTGIILSCNGGGRDYTGKEMQGLKAGQSYQSTAYSNSVGRDWGAI